ncbi:MAG: hypothetical protein ACTHOE_00560 [Conexibacter sp.]
MDLSVPPCGSARARLLVLAMLASLVASALAVADRAVASPLVWTQPQLIDPSFAATAVSCAPATSFCVAAASDGRVSALAGGSWAAPTTVDSSHAITSISCPTASFCMAVDDHGYALRYAGTWGAPQNVDSPASLASVSCVSASFCKAVDGAGYTLSYNGVTWSRGNLLDAGHSLASVSCASTAFCAATENGTSVFLFDGSFWSRPIAVGSGIDDGKVSCATPSFCVDVSALGYVTAYDGSSWSTPTALASSEPFTAISCPSGSFCVATNADHFVVGGDGSRWANTYLDGTMNSLEAVSCASVTFCVVLDDAGNALTSSASVPPAFETPPTISGTPAVGQSLFCDGGSLSGVPAPQISGRSWQRDGAPIPGAAVGTYQVATADEGHALTCSESVFNVAGNASATSAPVEVPIVPIVTSGLPPSQGTPATTPAPGGRLELPGARRFVVRRGHVRLRLDCRASAPCVGTAQLLVPTRSPASRGCPGHHRKRMRGCSIGSARFRIPANSAELVGIALDVTGKRLLRSARRGLAVELTVTTAIGGRPSTATKRIRLTSAR